MTDAPQKAAAAMTERQRKWFATVQANFETRSGRPLADWLEIMKACPETTSGKRSAWLRSQYGLGANHAAYLLSRMPGAAGWDDSEALKAALWKDAGSLTLHDAVIAAASGLEGLVVSERKSFTSLSKDVQFAAMRPSKGGKALLGLKLEPEASPRLTAPTRREAWSERLTAVVELSDPSEVDAEIADLLRRAYARG